MACGSSSRFRPVICGRRRPDTSLTAQVAGRSGRVGSARPDEPNGAPGADRRATGRDRDRSSCESGPAHAGVPGARRRALVRQPALPVLNNKLLGPPLHTEQHEHERLGKPTGSRSSPPSTSRRTRRASSGFDLIAHGHVNRSGVACRNRDGLVFGIELLPRLRIHGNDFIVRPPGARSRTTVLAAKCVGGKASLTAIESL